MAKVLTQFEAARAAPLNANQPWSETLQRRAQRRWAETPILLRLYALQRLRHCLADRADEFAAAVQRPGRSQADTLAAEVLPLLDACKFLEREAEEILRPRCEPAHARPLWMQRLSVETHREPFGLVLIIAPSNYPLLLAGVQALQALAAGNAVIWKPGAGGEPVARIFADAVLASGMDPALLHVTDDSVRSATHMLEHNLDKVVFTGSAATGTRVREALADRAIPLTMELSGCDSVFILVDADLDRVAEALVFGCRFNGSATCMAPRRIFVPAPLADELEKKLVAGLLAVPPVVITPATELHLEPAIRDACAMGARLALDGRSALGFAPMLLTGVRPEMAVARADIFAPLLMLMPFRYEREAVEADRECPYALSASIFGSEKAARKLAAEIEAGCIVINDIIAATGDPRVAFGGRRASGYGVTRGRDGLLDMTAVKTLMIRRGDDRRIYRIHGETHGEMFGGYIDAVHGEGLARRWSATVQAIKGAILLGKTGNA